MPDSLPPRIELVGMTKPWWCSRTLWVNAIVAVLAVAETQFQLLQPLLPVNVFALFAFALPLLNAWLRVVTTVGLKFGSGGAR